jgi:hypothetical protein
MNRIVRAVIAFAIFASTSTTEAAADKVVKIRFLSWS